MSGFLYFKPNCSKPVTLDDVKAWGLDYAFTGSLSSAQCVGPATPGGSNGMVFADEKRLGEYAAKIDVDEQRWEKSADGDWYVGYWKKAPPVPVDLDRPSQLPGFFVKIGEHEWHIPLVCQFDEDSKRLTTALPCSLKYSGNGKWTKGDVVKIHRQLWAIGQSFRDDFIDRYVHDKPARNFSDDEVGEALFYHLAANYVVGRDELSLLEVVAGNDSCPAVAIMVANDMRTLLEWSKKKSAEHVTPAG